MQGLGDVVEKINKEQSQSSDIVVRLVGLARGLIALGRTDIGFMRDLMPRAIQCVAIASWYSFIWRGLPYVSVLD